MTRMLINGCSYGQSYDPAGILLSNRLGFDEAVNLSIPGGSNSRCFRTTLDYILENQVDFVMLMLTYCQRLEEPWADNIEIEGSWVSYSLGNLPNYQYLENKKGINIRVDKDDIETYIKYQAILNSYYAYREKVLNDLLLFTGWLDSKNIKYCIFGSCDMYYDYPQLTDTKRKQITTNKKIIDIFSWSSNKFLSEHGATCIEGDINLNPYQRHYDYYKSQLAYEKLNDFLYNYIKENCI